jgi:hypothetical protein
MSKTSDYQTRLGAMQLAGAFALLFLLLHLLRHRSDPLFLYVAVVCLVAGVFFYRLLTPVFRLWFRLGTLLNKVVGPLVFGLLFYVFLTPVALLRRLFGGKGLPTGFARPGESAWIERGDEPFTPSEFERQF